jgi:hypothetical protein
MRTAPIAIHSNAKHGPSGGKYSAKEFLAEGDQTLLLARKMNARRAAPSPPFDGLYLTQIPSR